MYLAEINNVSKSFGTTKILNNINLCIEYGKTYSVVGKSGSGKSTLLHILGTLDNPTSGKVYIEGTDVNLLKDKELSLIRNKSIGFIFQSNLLLEDFNVIENAATPLLIRGVRKSEAFEKASDFLDKVGLKDRKNFNIGKLSGGEKQRVAIVRALINNAKLILADEPTGSLDEANQEEMEDLLLNVVNSNNRSLLLVTHNNDFAEKCENCFVLKDGLLEKK